MKEYPFSITEGGAVEVAIKILNRVKAHSRVWIQKGGERIKLEDMTDSHITNTLKMLEKRAKLQALEVSDEIGDLNQMFYWREHLPIMWETLSEELIKRLK